MPDIAIHQLPPAGALSGGEIVPVDNGTATVQTTVAAIRQGLAAAVHGHAVADVTGLQAALDGKAPLAHPSFTGAVTMQGNTTLGSGTSNSHTINGALAVVGNLSVAGTGLFSTSVPAAHVASRFRNLDATGWSTLWIGTANDGVIVGGAGASAYASQMVFVTSGTRPVIVAPNNVETVRFAADGSVTHRNNATTIIDASSHLGLRSYTVATLPSAAPAARLIFVSDGASDKRLAVSDGTSWRWPDGAIVN